MRLYCTGGLSDVHKIVLYINKTGPFSTKYCNVKSMNYKNTPLYFIVLFSGFSSFVLPNFCCFSHILESFLFLLLGDTVKFILDLCRLCSPFLLSHFTFFEYFLTNVIIYHFYFSLSGFCFMIPFLSF